MPEFDTINLHPSSHPPSALPTKTYDIICLGSGWAGRVLAARCAGKGLSSVIVEEELLGGDCPFWACVPSKALLRPQQALDAALAVGGVRELFAPSSTSGGSAELKVDPRAVFRRRDAYTHHWDDAFLGPLLENSGVVIVRGTGSIVGERKVLVRNVAAGDRNGEEVLLEARYVVAVCTGSEPVIPKEVAGLADARPWGPRQATSSSAVPEHLLVLGGGAVGTEMATAYASLGAKVTLVTKTEELLPKVDVEAGRLVRNKLIEKGVAVYTSTRATSAKRGEDGSVTVELTNGETIRATEILVASGRKARTAGIGLEQFGLKTDGAPLEVDETLCVAAVSGGWLYALGDVNGRAPLTHSSKYHGRIAANAIVAKFKDRRDTDTAPYSAYSATADLEAQPQVVFTNPTVASVGMTRASAQAKGLKFREVTAPLSTLGAKLHAEGYEDGWAQWIIEESTGRLLGATLVGDDAAELLHPSTVAVVGGLTLDRLAHAVPPFPTMSEVYLNLLEAAGL